MTELQFLQKAVPYPGIAFRYKGEYVVIVPALPLGPLEEYDTKMASMKAPPGPTLPKAPGIAATPDEVSAYQQDTAKWREDDAAHDVQMREFGIQVREVQMSFIIRAIERNYPEFPKDILDDFITYDNIDALRKSAIGHGPRDSQRVQSPGELKPGTKP